MAKKKVAVPARKRRPTEPVAQSRVESPAGAFARAQSMEPLSAWPGAPRSFAEANQQREQRRFTRALEAHTRALEALRRPEPEVPARPQRRDMRADFAAFFAQHRDAANSPLGDEKLLDEFAPEYGYRPNRSTMNRHRRKHR